MNLNFHRLDSMIFIFIFILIFVSTVSSRPIATDPQHHVAAATPSPTTLMLRSCDGEKFEVKLQVALQSETIKQVIVHGGFSFSDRILLSFPNMTGETMGKVLEYCNKHVYYDGAGNNMTAMEEMRAFDAQFVNVHYEMLFKLIRAADFLNIKSLLDLSSQTVADMMKGKTSEEIRKIFNIKNDFTPEEEEEVRRENVWAFE